MKHGLSLRGIDLAKNVFQLHAEDASGMELWRNRRQGAGRVSAPAACRTDRHGGERLDLRCGPTADDAVRADQERRTKVARSLERERDLLVKQRTQLANAVRGLLAEQGIIARIGQAGFEARAAEIDAADSAIPRLLLTALKPLVEQWRALRANIDALEADIVIRGKSDERMCRLLKIPGVGPITAHGLVTAIGDPRRFSGR